MNEIVVSEQRSLQPLRAAEIRQQIGVIQDVLKNVMQKDVHYGVIPGCQAPSLYKPGAEKIMTAFRISAEPEVVDLSEDDKVRYLVKVRLISSSGISLGVGIGECSSSEDKYKWRKPICKEEFEEAPAERKREKWMRGKGGSGYKVQQIRTEPSDLANTILKMAKKRALIDAVLTCTAASDCFTQDIEDLPPEYLEDVPRETGRAELAPYPQSDFEKNFPKWVGLISEGKADPEKIITMVSTKAILSDDQKAAIRNITAAAEFLDGDAA